MTTPPLEIGKNAMVADFVTVTKNRQASAYKFAFEVDEQNAQHFLSILGGLPTEGDSRPVIIWRPTIHELRAAKRNASSAAKKLPAQKALPKPTNREESDEEED